VLTAGLAHLNSKGVRVIEVTADSENEAALALYQSAGFEVCASSLWYEKVIN
jgi:ribosomal protein S18 acetylase RimI-like enzyme